MRKIWRAVHMYFTAVAIGAFRPRRPPESGKSAALPNFTLRSAEGTGEVKMGAGRNWEELELLEKRWASVLI